MPIRVKLKFVQLPRPGEWYASADYHGLPYFTTDLINIQLAFQRAERVLSRHHENTANIFRGVDI